MIRIASSHLRPYTRSIGLPHPSVPDNKIKTVVFPCSKERDAEENPGFIGVSESKQCSCVHNSSKFVVYNCLKSAKRIKSLGLSQADVVL